MKTKVLFIAIFFGLVFNTARSQEFKSPLSVLTPQAVSLLDSIHQYLWSKSTSDWTDYIFTYITRDTLGNMTKSFLKINLSGSWQNYIQELFAYVNPAHPVLSTHTSQLWNTLTNDWETFAYSHTNLQGQTDESFNKQWNQNTHKFISGYRDTMEFVSNMLSVNIHQVYDSVTKGWRNSTMTGYTYDAMNRMVQMLTQSWNDSSSSWINIIKMVTTYDTNNYLVLYETFVWDNSSMTWLNSQRISYLDYFGYNPLHIVTENWNMENNQWYLVDRHSNAYMSNGSKSQDIYEVYDTVMNVWVNSYLTDFTFYLSTLIQFERNGKFWNLPANQWVLNAYDQNDSLGRNVESYYKYYNTLNYQITGGSRNLTAYDTAGNRGNYRNQSFQVSTATWIDMMQSMYTYNALKNLTELLDQVYDATATAWINNSRTIYYYSSVSGISEPKPASRLCFYENPIHTGSLITCPDLKPGYVYSMTVYNLSGQIVMMKSFGGGESVVFDKNLPDGMYILRFTENGRPVYTGKLIVTK